MTKPETGLSLNERIERIERRHTEILISAPWATRSARWQVTAGGEAESFDNGWKMLAELEKRYPPA
jgi:hypothetical protein